MPMMRLDPETRIDRRVMKHAAQGLPLSGLQLPFRTVVKSLCRCGIGVVSPTGQYALTWDRILAAATGVKATAAVRFDHDPDHSGWLARDNHSVSDTEIGAIWSALERQALQDEARMRREQEDHWAD